MEKITTPATEALDAANAKYEFLQAPGAISGEDYARAIGGDKAARIVNACLACFMALFTLLHMSELLETFNPVQLLIMPMMFVIALLMAVDSVKICKEA